MTNGLCSICTYINRIGATKGVFRASRSHVYQTYLDQGWILFKVYKDIDTGTHGKRPGFIQMLEDAKENKFDIILEKDL